MKERMKKENEIRNRRKETNSRGKEKRRKRK